MIKEYVQKLPGGKDLLLAQYVLGMIVGATLMYGYFVLFGFTAYGEFGNINRLSRDSAILGLLLICGFLWVFMLVVGTIGYYQQINRAENIYMKENSTSNAAVSKETL